jgi:hypothetical protein
MNMEKGTRPQGTIPVLIYFICTLVMNRKERRGEGIDRFPMKVQSAAEKLKHSHQILAKHDRKYFLEYFCNLLKNKHNI